MSLPETENKIRIGGIKFLENLALLTITEPYEKRGEAMRLFAILAENEINISMISRITDGKTDRSDCSVSEDNLERIFELIDPYPGLKKRINVLRGLGAISIYPHKSRMNLMGRVLMAFGRKNIPLYNMTSSISSFVFLTECRYLDNAVEALKEYFTLPENHAPFKREFCIKHVRKQG